MMPSKYRELPEVLIDAAMIMPAPSWIAVPPKRSPEKENEKLLVDDVKMARKSLISIGRDRQSELRDFFDVSKTNV